MIQIKTFWANISKELDKEVNAWLEENFQRDVVDIKLSCYGDENSDAVCAMIIYR